MALATVAMAAMFGACTSNDPFNNNAGETVLVKTPDFRVTSGSEVLAQTKGLMKAPETVGALTYATRSYTWTNPVEIFEHFPEFQTPEGYYDDFVFVSNGQPFDIVMLYSNGGYRHLMGIYWYENGNYYEQQLWDERDDENAHTWENFNGSDSKGAISRRSDNAGAYTICLPKGTKFGFYSHSLLYGEDIKEGIHTPLPFGPVVDYIYKFYTEKEKNWSYMVAEYDKYAEQGKTTTQAMTTTINNWTIVGFEDRSITHPGCDRDYNDCVFAMNPQQLTEEEVLEEPVEESVEINLSVNDEHVNGDYIASKLSIHVRAVTDVEVFIPVEKQYYCEADDMDISLSHKELDVLYNVEPQYVEMQIGASKVTFMVQYEADGIRVATSGVNQDVINYCAEHYGDGISFEVWNYFNGLTRADLKPMLDLSTVTFLTRNPKYYVNAFAKKADFVGPVYNAFNEDGQLVPYTDFDCTQPLDPIYWTRLTPAARDYVFLGEKNPWDCIVTPAETSYQKTEPDASDATLPDYNVCYTL